MAVKRQKVVSQCAMQTASDDAPDSLSLTPSSARSSASSSQHSSNVEGVSALDILLTGNHDVNNFVRREFQRAATALPTMRNIMADVDAIPIEEVQEASHACAVTSSNRVAGGGKRGKRRWMMRRSGRMRRRRRSS